MENNFRSGFVSIIGRPNVGKSTIMNLLIGEKIAIMSHRPQTTRNKIRTILTTDDFQAVFIDTPGLHTPKSKLGDYMVKSAENALKEVDIVLYVVEPYEEIKKSDMDIIERLKGIKTPVYLIINKIDTVEKPEVLKVIDAYSKVYDFKEILPFSALKAVNSEELKELIKKGLPEGPKYFPEDMITDQPERQLCAEIIREKALFLLNEEIPHGIAVEVTAMKKREDGDMTDVFANIYCEKNSHKGIIIGKQGAMLKKIGTKARIDIERLL
ncbi:MAG: GTPase Era, partial [Clostridiales bacterium]|nr:GTPase Era [Clostridiales bacterium]